MPNTLQQVMDQLKLWQHPHFKDLAALARVPRFAVSLLASTLWAITGGNSYSQGSKGSYRRRPLRVPGRFSGRTAGRTAGSVPGRVLVRVLVRVLGRVPGSVPVRTFRVGFPGSAGLNPGGGRHAGGI
eukprot:1195109-Prorocentrum_minimum.AAC.3